MLFYLYVENQLALSLDMSWATGPVKIDRTFMTQPFYNTYLRTMNRHFWEWLNEMKRNKRSFAPFNLKVDGNKLFDVVEGVKPKSGLFERGANYARMDYILSKTEPKIKTRKPEQFFVELFDRSTEELVRDKFAF